MNRELLREINNKGKILGYPLFVMKGGQILKTPPQNEPFELVVFDELDEHEGLNGQKIKTYSQWLAQSLQPNDFLEMLFVGCSSEEVFLKMFQVPSSLRPYVRVFQRGRLCIYAEPNISYCAICIDKIWEVNYQTTGIQVDKLQLEEDGIAKIYYYIHKVSNLGVKKLNEIAQKGNVCYQAKRFDTEVLGATNMVLNRIKKGNKEIIISQYEMQHCY